MDLLSIASLFQLEGDPVSCVPCGSGHINKTFAVTDTSGKKGILQIINHHVFHDVDALMRNIVAVTRHLKAKCPDPRQVLTLIPARDGAYYIHTEDGQYYRMTEYVDHGISLDQAAFDEDFYQSAVAFGTFQRLLSDFPAETLTEVIPHFHDTPDRFRLFHMALQSDRKNRANLCEDEIRFALAHEKEAGAMMDMLHTGALPLRVTHNDTKLNNVMLDADTRKPLCVIDLDTVMPGLAGNDFGDSIRFGASTALEDEEDLELVHLSLPLFQAYTRGFLSACGKALTRPEIDTLPLSAKLMTLEVGLRFLTDYLNGDTYFSISRENHNLDRCRTQFRLLADMEAKEEEMNRIVQETYSAL